jgi:hypothetical protein
VTLAIKIILALVVVTVASGSVLRIRKLRRDRSRGRSTKIDRRLMTPPPSPYSPSKGFRLLDGAQDNTAHSQPPRPRLEPDHEYVFSDAQLPPYDLSNLAHLRHDEHWALSRSARRAKFSVAGIRTALIVAVIVIVLGVVAFYVLHPGHSKSPTTSTTTPTSTTTKSSSSIGAPVGASYVIAAAKTPGTLATFY